MVETAKDFEARIIDIEKTTSRLAAIEARDAQIRANEREKCVDRAVVAALRYANTLLTGVELDEAEIALCAAAGRDAMASRSV